MDLCFAAIAQTMPTYPSDVCTKDVTTEGYRLGLLRKGTHLILKDKCYKLLRNTNKDDGLEMTGSGTICIIGGNKGRGRGKTILGKDNKMTLMTQPCPQVKDAYRGCDILLIITLTKNFKRFKTSKQLKIV